MGQTSRYTQQRRVENQIDYNYPTASYCRSEFALDSTLQTQQVSLQPSRYVKRRLARCLEPYSYRAERSRSCRNPALVSPRRFEKRLCLCPDQFQCWPQVSALSLQVLLHSPRPTVSRLLRNQ